MNEKRFVKTWAKLQPEKEKIDYTPLIEKLNKAKTMIRLHKGQIWHSIHVVDFIATLATIGIGLLANANKNDKIGNEQLKAYSQPIENERLSPQTTTGELIQETIK
jgi:hypothetical protein